MKHFLHAVITGLMIVAFISGTVSADVINPEYFSKTCNPSEREVTCSYRSRIPFGPKTYDECAKYEHNPSYRYLVGEGHSFGGSVKYCFRAMSLYDHVTTLLPLIAVTLLLEIPLFIVTTSRKRNAVLTVIYANLISVPLLYFTTNVIPYSGFYVVLLMETAVIIFETAFIYYRLKDIKFGNILAYSILANGVSAILGGMLLTIIRGFLMV